MTTQKRHREYKIFLSSINFILVERKRNAQILNLYELLAVNVFNGKFRYHKRNSANLDSSDAAHASTSTDDLIISNIAPRNAVSQSVPMHDAHLACNNEVSGDGTRVTDLIVELRDDTQTRPHFMPCPRNTKG